MVAGSIVPSGFTVGALSYPLSTGGGLSVAEVVVLLRKILEAFIVKAALTIITSMISRFMVIFFVMLVPALKGPRASNLPTLAFT